jgi:hypothetical protein
MNFWTVTPFIFLHSKLGRQVPLKRVHLQDYRVSVSIIFFRDFLELCTKNLPVTDAEVLWQSVDKPRSWTCDGLLKNEHLKR